MAIGVWFAWTSCRSLAPPVMSAAKIQRLQSQDIETWLDEAGVEWTFLTSIPLDQIDFEKSLPTQARFVALAQSVVDRNAEAITAGDKFPACRAQAVQAL